MKANTLENLILDQIFKIKPMDKQFSEFMEDCIETKTKNN